MDLIRDMLLKIEELPFDGTFPEFEIPGRTQEELYYHAQLMQDNGLLKAKFGLGFECVVERLTYEGHEFLDAARSEKMWKKAKETLQMNAGTLTLEALETALAILIKHAAAGIGI